MKESIVFLPVFSGRTQRVETIVLRLTREGWSLQYEPTRWIAAGPTGFPALRWLLESHQLRVPVALADAMEELWEAAHLEHLDAQFLQERLTQFGLWLNAQNSANSSSLAAISGMLSLDDGASRPSPRRRRAGNM